MQFPLEGSQERMTTRLQSKLDGVLAPGGYRPVSLQNCSMKAVCKALTTRLQSQIGSLIDENQSGFLSGRSISENFVFATEMVQCCYKRKTPTVILKLDFSKAFDSIDWAVCGRSWWREGSPCSGATGWT
jgi:hypothetical protein